MYLRHLLRAACLVAAIGAMVSVHAAAQAGRGRMGGPALAVRSPEVHVDRTVTFRLRAPDQPEGHR